MEIIGFIAFTFVFYAFIGLLVWMIMLQSDVNKIKRQLKNSQQPPQENSTKITSADPQKTEVTVKPAAIKEETKPIQKPVAVTIKEKPNFEARFMGNYFHKIGAVALLIALCMLIKIISPYFVFTDEMKIALGFISGLGMIFGSFRIKKDGKMQKFSEALMGTGFGAILITIYCGAGFLEIFSMPVAMALAIITTVSMYFVADNQKSMSMIILGLIGGYLNPFFIQLQLNTNFMFWYFIFLNALSLVFVMRNMDKEIINPINLFLSAFLIVYAPVDSTYTIHMVVILWGLYILYDMLNINQPSNNIRNSLRYLNFAVLTVLSGIVYIGKPFDYGIFLAVMSVIYMFFGFCISLKNKLKENAYFYSCVILIFLSTLFLTVDNPLTMLICWSVEAVILSLLALKFEFKRLFGFASWFIAAVLLKTFVLPEIYDITYETPVLNERILYFLPSVISCWLISLISKKFSKQSAFEIFRFLGISLLYVYAMFEINAVYGGNNYYENLTRFLIPIIFFVYALNFSFISKTSELKSLFSSVSKIALWFGAFWLIVVTDVFGQLSSNHYGSMLPVLNLRLAAYGALGANLWYNFKIQKREKLKYIAIILGFLYVHFETVNVVQYFNYIGIEWLISVMWILYAGAISILGIFKNLKPLKVMGIWLGIISIGRIFIFDLANVDLLYKLIGFITLGVVLMLISYFYNKKN